MEITIKGSGSRTWPTVRAPSSMLTVRSMRVNGNRTSTTDTELKHGLTTTDMKVSTRTVLNKALARSIGPMVLHISENSPIITSMARASTPGLTVANTRVSGVATR